MVSALIAGDKTQTRRLGTSPVRHYLPGDMLWVREGWSTAKRFDDLAPRDLAPCSVHYDADGAGRIGRRRASFHMPIWASRITLRVRRVFFEQLQSISSSDAIAEGIRRNPHGNCDHWLAYPAGSSAAGYISPRDSYRTLWDSLHKADGETWRDNPFVVALEFDVMRMNIERVKV